MDETKAISGRKRRPSTAEPTKQRSSGPSSKDNKESANRKTLTKGPKGSIKSTASHFRAKKSVRGRSASPRAPLTPSPSDTDFPVAGEDESVPTTSTQDDPITNEPTAQEICMELLEEFRKEAWDISMERFMMDEGKDLILYELRDTWLRIMSCEWMDQTKVAPETLPASFDAEMKDGPPLPLTFDFWAKGTLEEYPRTKMESVFDPFFQGTPKGSISTIETGGGDGFSQFGSDITGGFRSAQSIARLEESLGRIAGSVSGMKKKKSTSLPSLLSSIAAGDGQQDKKISSSENAMPKKSSSGSAVPPVVLGNASLSRNTSSTALIEVDTIKAPVSIKSSKSFQYQQHGLKPWTISQCGGRDGTQNVFRLINQTTSEALGQRQRQSIDVPNESKLLDTNETNDAEEQEEPNAEKDVEDLDTFQTLSTNDEDTEFLYEGQMNDHNDRSPESVSKVPSDLDFANNLAPFLPFEENSAKGGRGIEQDEKKSVIDSKLAKGSRVMKRFTKQNPNPVKNPKADKAVAPKKNLGLRQIKTAPLVSTKTPKSIAGSSNQNLPKEICKPQDDELMKNRLVIAKIRNDLIQQHRNYLRKRLSTAKLDQ